MSQTVIKYQFFARNSFPKHFSQGKEIERENGRKKENNISEKQLTKLSLSRGVVDWTHITPFS